MLPHRLVIDALEAHWADFENKGVTDLGILIDWCGLYQAPRTEEQTPIFAEALKGNRMRSYVSMMVSLPRSRSSSCERIFLSCAKSENLRKTAGKRVCVIAAMARSATASGKTSTGPSGCTFKVKATARAAAAALGALCHEELLPILYGEFDPNMWYELDPTEEEFFAGAVAAPDGELYTFDEFVAQYGYFDGEDAYKVAAGKPVEASVRVTPRAYWSGPGPPPVQLELRARVWPGEPFQRCFLGGGAHCQLGSFTCVRFGVTPCGPL